MGVHEVTPEELEQTSAQMQIEARMILMDRLDGNEKSFVEAVIGSALIESSLLIQKEVMPRIAKLEEDLHKTLSVAGVLTALKHKEALRLIARCTCKIPDICRQEEPSNRCVVCIAKEALKCESTQPKTMEQSI